MVNYELKKFNRYPTENPEEYIEEFRLWLIDSGIDVGAGHANRINAYNVFIISLKANIQGKNAGQIGAQVLNYTNEQNASLY
ncbi:9929_t:CDS:2, partial [Acaulospora morrowiae]